MGILPRLGFGRKQPEDPLVRSLSEIPVPLGDAGPLVDGLVPDEARLVRVSSRGDRELGAIAEYRLQLLLPREVLAARLFAVAQTLGEERPPCVTWLRQLVVLLADAHAAARWFGDRGVKFRDYGGREIGGFRYQQIDVVPLAGLGDEAQMLIGPNDTRGLPFVDTYVNVRRGRFFGCVSVSTFKDLDVRDQLRELAGRLVTRMDGAYREERQ